MPQNTHTAHRSHHIRTILFPHSPLHHHSKVDLFIQILNVRSLRTITPILHHKHIPWFTWQRLRGMEMARYFGEGSKAVWQHPAPLQASSAGWYLSPRNAWQPTAAVLVSTRVLVLILHPTDTMMLEAWKGANGTNTERVGNLDISTSLWAVSSNGGVNGIHGMNSNCVIRSRRKKGTAMHMMLSCWELSVAR